MTFTWKKETWQMPDKQREFYVLYVEGVERGFIYDTGKGWLSGKGTIVGILDFAKPPTSGIGIYRDKGEAMNCVELACGWLTGAGYKLTIEPASEAATMPLKFKYKNENQNLS